MRCFLRLILSITLFTTGLAWAEAGSDARRGVEGMRKSVKNDFLWVGKIRSKERFRCSTWLIAHGLAVTARHCFRDQNFENLDLAFGELASHPVIVSSQQILGVYPDSGENDFIFIRYQSDATKGKIEVNHTIQLEPLDTNISLMVVGFPFPRFTRVLSEDCHSTGFIGTFPPKEKDKGYVGEFIDTTCAAWYGVSGGAVFSLDPHSQKTIVYGVLTHTFDVNDDGSINNNYVQSDSLGNMTTGMFSPFSASHDLPKLLQEVIP